MARLTKAYFSKFHDKAPHRSSILKDEERQYEVDFNGALESETVSSVSWATDDEAIITIAGPTLSAGIAKVNATADNSGAANLSCTATLSSGRVLKQWFRIVVRDEPRV